MDLRLAGRQPRWESILLKCIRAKVTAVYVADTSRLGYLSDYIQYSGMVRELMLKEGKDATDRVEELSKNAGVTCEKVVLEGRPSDELLRMSKDLGVDLLVMGSVGRGGQTGSCLAA